MVSSKRIDYFSIKFKVLSRQFVLSFAAFTLALGFQVKSFGQFSILEQDPYLTCVGETITLHTSSSTSFSDYNWYIEGLPFSLGQLDTFQINSIDQYDNIYIVTADSSGTLVSDTINLFGFIRPALELGEDKAICSGDSVRFFDTTGSSGLYSWKTGGSTFETIAKTTGMYILSKFESIANPCESLDTVNLTVYPQPLIDLGPNTRICPGGSHELATSFIQEGTAPYTYNWTPNEAINDTTSPTPTVSPTTVTSYILNLTDGSPTSCSTSDTIEISISPELLISTLFSDSIICINDSLTLGVIASGGTPFSTGTPYIYSWVPNNNIIDETKDTPTVFPSGQTTYNVTVSDTLGCSKETSINIQISSVSVSLSTMDTTICPNSKITLSAIPNADTASFTYNWSKDLSSLPSSSAMIEVEEPGTYSVTVENTFSCSASADVEIATLDITLIDSINIVIPDSAINTTDFDLRFSAIGSNLTYLWSSDGAGLIDIISDSSTVYTPNLDESGATKFTITITNECSSFSAEGSTIIFGPPSGPKNIFIPNTVVPSSLDENLNSLRVYSTGIEFDELSLTIFNGNGEVVFETDDAQVAKNEGWNAIPNHSDVYSYVLQFLEKGTSIKQEKHGTITALQ